MPTVERAPVLLDSNIWLYAFILDSKTEAKRRVARQLVSMPQILLTPQIINEVTYNLVRRVFASEDQVCWIIQSMFQKHEVVPFQRIRLCLPVP